MQKLYGTLATVFFFLGLLFIALEFVYGYVFHQWGNALQALSHPNAQGVFSLTKFGETMLFGFLAVALLLASVAASLLHGRQSD